MIKRLNDICKVNHAQSTNGGGTGNYKSTGKHINVVCKNLSNEVIYVKRLTYDKSKMNTLSDVVEKIKRNKEVKNCHFISGYTYNIREQILYSDYLKNDKIDWNRRFDDVDLDLAFDCADFDEIAIVLLESPARGAAGGEIFDAFKTIRMIIDIVLALLYPFDCFEKATGYSKRSVSNVILKSTNWKEGIISSAKFKNSGLVEWLIMKKIGYKRINGIWYSTISNLD